MNFLLKPLEPGSSHPDSSLLLAGEDTAGTMEWSTQVLGRIARNELTVAIVGLGYVGLPLADAFITRGQSVIGIDVDEDKIARLRAGESYIRHISADRIGRMLRSDRFSVTADFSAVAAADAILLCVPTPLNDDNGPDLRFVESACQLIAPHLRRGQLVVLESTTWPGTSEEVMKPILEAGSGLRAHVDFAMAYSPEREDPGNENYGTLNIPKVVGANTEVERELAIAVYSKVTKAIEVGDLKTAEASKLLENIFRLVNISLINELNTIFTRMGIDTWAVIEAARTKPFGFMPFYPGPGIGGHCIPIDPFYLTHKAREFGLDSEFIELAGRVMRSLPHRVADLVDSELHARQGLKLAGARVLVVGLAYKKNVDDMRESPALQVIDILRERGALVEYHDPYIPEVVDFHEHPSINGMKSVDIDNCIDAFDCAVIVTEHRNVDYLKLVRTVPFVIDTRNATEKIYSGHRERIVKA